MALLARSTDALQKLAQRLPGSLVRFPTPCVEDGLCFENCTRAFRNSFGMSPYRWLLERRIDRAKALLVTSDVSIGDIALQSGFSD